MNRWLKYLLILVLAASIPLEGLAAVDHAFVQYAFCRHGDELINHG